MNTFEYNWIHSNTIGYIQILLDSFSFDYITCFLKTLYCSSLSGQEIENYSYSKLDRKERPREKLLLNCINGKTRAFSYNLYRIQGLNTVYISLHSRETVRVINHSSLVQMSLRRPVCKEKLKKNLSLVQLTPKLFVPPKMRCKRGWVIYEARNLRAALLLHVCASGCLLRKSKVICTNWKNFKCIALRVLEKFYLHLCTTEMLLDSLFSTLKVICSCLFS